MSINFYFYAFVFCMLLMAFEPTVIEFENLVWWIVRHPIRTVKNVVAYVGGTR